MEGGVREGAGLEGRKEGGSKRRGWRREVQLRREGTPGGRTPRS